jgi:hypothetical protein
MRGTIDLEHHPLSQPSVSAASVLGGTPLSWSPDPVSPKELADLLTTELALLVVFELFGQR